MNLQKHLNKILVILGFIITLLIVGIIFSWKKVQSSQENVSLIQKENQSLSSDIKILKESLQLSNEVRKQENKVKDSLNKEVSKFTKIIDNKNKELASIKGKYNKLDNDTLVDIAINTYEHVNDTTISRITNIVTTPRSLIEWGLENNDKIDILKNILTYKDSTILAKDSRIKSDSSTINSYKQDSVTTKIIISKQDKIISNDSSIVKGKDQEIKAVKTQRNVSIGVALIILALSLL